MKKLYFFLIVILMSNLYQGFEIPEVDYDYYDQLKPKNEDLSDSDTDNKNNLNALNDKIQSNNEIQNNINQNSEDLQHLSSDFYDEDEDKLLESKSNQDLDLDLNHRNLQSKYILKYY